MKPTRRRQALLALVIMMASHTLLAQTGDVSREPDTTLATLPLTELPVAGKGDLMAVIWSGDGGWRDLDKTIGEDLQRQGIPVVGVDSLRYFWHEKTPDRIATDLAAILRHYRAAWGRSRVILVGYSFGADIMPFAVNRLPDDVKRHIVRISLLGVARDATFGIHVADKLLGHSSQDARPLLPEVSRLDLGKVQCFYGEEESDSACPSAVFDSAERIETRGGHHFDGDYAALARRILDGIE
ncbi:MULTISPECIES: virulence factor [unclassified Modicisalibacter]|uniref:virulence factor family protein n=1 Tax=unclassified Modicisalibacter TaxID=2679913 RepID=UPI001CCD3048|nr:MULTISPECIES: virulence factor [unclassified Modicisalibacter]MBZ9558792.1 hypothetical protein [Modicisalibacter sp. R2A 31.J]MBZ9575317.1 hypothetical protein [Modicisalibacter sp. MOD 31.J]